MSLELRTVKPSGPTIIIALFDEPHIKLNIINHFTNI